MGKQQLESCAKESLLGRCAKPEDIAPSFVFLASPQRSSYITGEVLPNLDRLEQKDWELARQLVRRCGELGLAGVDVAEAYGGLALDKVTSLIVSEGIGLGASFSAAGQLFLDYRQWIRRVGGLLIDYVHWRAIFFVLIPIALAGLTLALINRLKGNFAAAAPDSARLFRALSHTALTVHIATKFNLDFGTELFTLPDPYISPAAPRI